MPLGISVGTITQLQRRPDPGPAHHRVVRSTPTATVTIVMATSCSALARRLGRPGGHRAYARRIPGAPSSDSRSTKSARPCGTPPPESPAPARTPASTPQAASTPPRNRGSATAPAGTTSRPVLNIPAHPRVVRPGTDPRSHHRSPAPGDTPSQGCWGRIPAAAITPTCSPRGRGHRGPLVPSLRNSLCAGPYSAAVSRAAGPGPGGSRPGRRWCRGWPGTGLAIRRARRARRRR